MDESEGDRGSPAPHGLARRELALAALAAMARQASREFGKYGQVRDLHALVILGREEVGWPEGVSVRDLQRLEKINGRQGSGFNMVYQEKTDPWSIRLTPKGRAALRRILAAGNLIEPETEAPTPSSGA